MDLDRWYAVFTSRWYYGTVVVGLAVFIMLLVLYLMKGT